MLLIVLLLIAGIVFVYSAVKGVDPRELVKKALSKGR